MWKDVRNTIMVLMAALLLAGCNEDGFVGSGDSDPTGVSASVASITLLAGSPQIGSSGSARIAITAIVRDSRNNLLEDVPVVFSANSGALEVTQPRTDSAGQAIAMLSPGADYTNRQITVSAATGNLSEAVNVSVTGTSLAISGETSATLGDQMTITVTLRDSDNDPIPNRTVQVSSALGNVLSAATLNTNSAGQIQVTLTASVSGSDTIIASAQGASASHAITVSGDEFLFVTPAVDEIIEINSCAAVEVEWNQEGSPVSGQAVSFSATRGTFYTDAGCATPAATASVVVSAGTATIYIMSPNSGPSMLTAFVNNGPSTTRMVSFVATVPDTLVLQADPVTIGPNDGSESSEQRSTIIAVVRDPNNNLVAGKLVRFEVEDLSGGTLSSATATTDTLGRASTSYISSAATTAKDGVRIRAWVNEDATIQGTIFLTVAHRSLFVRLGTGNLIRAKNETQYEFPYSVIVTDANGNAAGGAQVGLSLIPLQYAKGEYTYNGTTWSIDPNDVDVCQSEDVNLNGILDDGEDINGDLKLTPGNVALVPGEITTGLDGTFQFFVTYPKDHAQWVRVRLTASTVVAGTESEDSATFWLPILADDLDDETPPPGVVSPFGTGPCP